MLFSLEDNVHDRRNSIRYEFLFQRCSNSRACFLRLSSNVVPPIRDSRVRILPHYVLPFAKGFWQIGIANGDSGHYSGTENIGMFFDERNSMIDLVRYKLIATCTLRPSRPICPITN